MKKLLELMAMASVWKDLLSVKFLEHLREISC